MQQSLDGDGGRLHYFPPKSVTCMAEDTATPRMLLLNTEIQSNDGQS
jgi:hypothetical protein